ncbi:hypothetical protein SAMN04488134_107144 [Amphibacillus marinus]|uniref:TPM domain-containing protein n=1 Tax=Amphibacillus marinus TaxID=872970 RepID=A0A1H8PQZ7_9BACI|nr:hypothetical protein [Amphibacillus marinus]SEO43953.1 hypothetical protein SAMN04488134_107144 [Amphibacillus marinus]
MGRGRGGGSLSKSSSSKSASSTKTASNLSGSKSTVSRGSASKSSPARSSESKSTVTKPKSSTLRGNSSGGARGGSGRVGSSSVTSAQAGNTAPLNKRNSSNNSSKPKAEAKDNKKPTAKTTEKDAKRNTAKKTTKDHKRQTAKTFATANTVNQTQSKRDRHHHDARRHDHGSNHDHFHEGNHSRQRYDDHYHHNGRHQDGYYDHPEHRRDHYHDSHHRHQHDRRDPYYDNRSRPRQRAVPLRKQPRRHDDHYDYDNHQQEYYDEHPRQARQPRQPRHRRPSNPNRGAGLRVVKLIGIGLLIFFGIIIFFSIISALFSESTSPVSGITPSTIERAPLESGVVNETDYFTDELNWVDNQTVLTNGLSHFYNETGVQPYVYMTDNIEGDFSPSFSSIEDYGNLLYDALFTDEAHLLLLFVEGIPADAYSMHYVTGTQAQTVIDAEAGDILFDYVAYYYDQDDVADSEFLSLAFQQTADAIMNNETDPFLIAVFVAFGVAVIFAFYYHIRKQKQRRSQFEGEKTEEMLNQPIEKFGTVTADSLASKYDEEEGV